MTQTIIFILAYLLGVYTAYIAGKTKGYDEFFKDFDQLEKESIERIKKNVKRYFDEHPIE